MRIGIGYDVHALVPNRKLILGGVHIPFPLGLLGHSDADVLIHAIMDALLGAAGLGVIGELFPDTDPTLFGISSLILLKKVHDLLIKKSFQIINLDTIVIAQAPKIMPYSAEMKISISKVLNTAPDNINIKATTTEKLGYLGRSEGIAAEAVVLLEKISVKG